MKVGLVGCGFICHQHLRALKRLPAVQVIGLCDRERQLAPSVADAYGVPQAHDSMERLLAAARPDVVHILTPPQSHCRLAIQALEAGCHVLVEKPMAMNAAEAEAMCAASRRTGRSLGVAHNYLFVPALLAAQAVDRAEAASARCSRPMSTGACPPTGRRTASRPGRGCGRFRVACSGGHAASRLRTAALMGRLEPSAVSVAGGDAGQASELVLLLASDRGPTTMSLSLRSNPVRKIIRVNGSRGSLEIDLATSVLVHTASQADGTVARALVNLATAGQIAAGTAANALRTALRRLPRGHETLIARFYAALRGRGAPPVSGDDGLRTVAVLDRIWPLPPTAASTGARQQLRVEATS